MQCQADLLLVTVGDWCADGKSSSPSCRVTQIEAERLDESREEREAFKRMLREEVERQAQEKHIEIHLPGDKS